jgi:hypothetical protein
MTADQQLIAVHYAASVCVRGVERNGSTTANPEGGRKGLLPGVSDAPLVPSPLTFERGDGADIGPSPALKTLASFWLRAFEPSLVIR